MTGGRAEAVCVATCQWKRASGGMNVVAAEERNAAIRVLLRPRWTRGIGDLSGWPAAPPRLARRPGGLVKKRSTKEVDAKREGEPLEVYPRGGAVRPLEERGMASFGCRRKEEREATATQTGTWCALAVKRGSGVVWLGPRFRETATATQSRSSC